MSVIMGQVPVAGNATVPAFTLPAGLCNFTVYQPTNPQAVYVGPSTTVSSVNGLPVPVTPIGQETYVAGKGVTYYATTGNGTASSFQYLISTAN
jgi:hypothetical protein